jgi:hypothetical protein
MALQAAHDCINKASNDDLPFGCSLDVLEGVLQSGGKYRDTNHQDVPQAIRARPDLTSRPNGLRIVSATSLIALLLTPLLTLSCYTPYL